MLPEILSLDSHWHMSMPGFVCGTKLMQRENLLASRVLFKLLGLVLSSEDCFNGLKQNPWFTYDCLLQINVTVIILTTIMGYNLYRRLLPSPIHAIAFELHPNGLMNTLET
ncbi:hypothetical protein NPIL_616821 [Nephila pilipes]|uniref:Uncharacterized protein n=1 Tax=Nephila pilipes TaxID=299642 RepID=A0A8X6TW34_NEPPI|nr:hypothetical protein NPIL_616821 [Nephila pilipes]